MYKVVLTDSMKKCPEEIILREFGASFIYGDAKTEDDVIAVAKDADAIINVYAPISAKVINGLEKCQIVVRRGIGFDTLDLEAAAVNGLVTVNVPEYCTDEVADQAMALLMAAARRLVICSEQTRAGGWDFKECLPVPPLRGSTLGLAGFGKIPRAVAERAKPFALKIITSDPFITPELAREHGVKLVGFEELLRTSDFLSIHVPLSEKTQGMFSKKEFDMMKPSSVLINTSRGPLVDEAALIEALQTGKIAYAGLDVMVEEPPSEDNPLRKMKNVIMTPHIAWYSERSVQIMGEKVAQAIINVFNGRIPDAVLNPDVLKIRTDLKP